MKSGSVGLSGVEIGVGASIVAPPEELELLELPELDEEPEEDELLDEVLEGFVVGVLLVGGDVSEVSDPPLPQPTSTRAETTLMTNGKAGLLCLLRCVCMSFSNMGCSTDLGPPHTRCHYFTRHRSLWLYQG